MERLNVLVTGGSTRVMIDKVRCIGNIFKGRTAIDIAKYFGTHGCAVTIIGTPVMKEKIDADPKMHRAIYNCFKEYTTYEDLYDEMEYSIRNNRYDIVIHSAAVSDYKVADVLNSDMESIRAGKVSSDSKEIYLKLVKTEKIVDKIRDWGLNGKLVKFKLQVDMPVSEIIEVAKASRAASNADVIVSNCLEWARHSAILIGRDEEQLVARDDLPRKLYEMVTK